ncbi:MAG: hypothetical protein K2X50_07490 [Gammaproteobacteria bacterium]|nr:hypothetical protein [Gammaproteobacteria bacterium]
MLKRHVLHRPEYTENEKNRMRSVHRCWHNAMPDEGLPDFLKMNAEFTLSTHNIDEIHTQKGTWIADIKEHGLLQTESDAMIGHLCAYMVIRWKRKFGKNGNTNDPYNLVCYQLLTWLTNTLSRAPCSESTLKMVKKYCDYLNNLLNSGAFKPGRHNKKTMRSTLIRVKNILAGRVTLAIKREIANTSAREHLETLQNYSKIILSNGFRFLYHIFNSTENTPPPNITRFRRRESDYEPICSTSIGMLLTTLADTPEFSSFFLEEHQKKGTLAVNSYDTINNTGQARKLSLRATQLSSNPFLDKSNNPCIPRALMQSQKISDFLNPTTIPKQNSKAINTGIYKPIQLNPQLLEAYMEMHTILIELAKVFMGCDEAKALAGIGGDLLVYGISNDQINRLMDTLTKLCTRLLECQKTLVTICDQIYEPLTHENKTSEAANINWVKNYEKIASLQRKLEQATTKSIKQASLVKEKSNIIPKEERLKTAQKQTQYFARITEQLNHQVDYFLRREPTPTLPSSQSNWKSAQLKHTTQNSSLKALPDSARVEVLEDESPQTEAPNGKQLAVNFRTSMSNLRNMLRNKKSTEKQSEVGNSAESQNSETSSTEPKPRLSTKLRTSRSHLPSFGKQSGLPATSDAPEISPEATDTAAPVAGTSPRKQQLGGSLRKSFTKLLRLGSSGEDSAQSSTANSLSASRARAATTTGGKVEPPSFDRSAIRKKETDTAQPSPVISPRNTPMIAMLEPAKELPCKRIEILGDATTDQYVDDTSIGWTLEMFLMNAPEATEIHLQRNRITGIGAVKLCKLLSKHAILEKLNCSSNKTFFSWVACDDFDSAGWAAAKNISNLIANHTSLKELNISDCGLTSAGSQCLALGLEKNKTLEFLDLSDNPIGIDGALEICTALRHHPTLQSLMIMGIKLNEKCGNAFCHLLEENPRITFLAFNEANNFSDETTQRIYELLNNNRRRNSTPTMK